MAVGLQSLRPLEGAEEAGRCHEPVSRVEGLIAAGRQKRVSGNGTTYGMMLISWFDEAGDVELYM